jgi:hypothetical protein
MHVDGIATCQIMVPKGNTLLIDPSLDYFVRQKYWFLGLNMISHIYSITHFLLVRKIEGVLEDT